MKKINIAELLKDCPKGMELDCYLFDGLEFDHIDTDSENYPIVCRVKSSKSGDNIHVFNKYGWYNAFFDYSKCVIFPKGKTTWEGFQRPFIDGDVVYNRLQDTIGIVMCDEDNFPCEICDVSKKGVFWYNEGSLIAIVERDYRLATEEEKRKLFDAIKDNGYRWNAETKTLGKLIEPKFKVGDRIRKENNNSRVYTINGVYSSMYGVEGRDFGILIEEQDEWELVPNKFDINTLKPYDKVLVRLTKDGVWNATFFSHYDKEVKWGCYPFVTTSSKSYSMCIPYEGNEHLLGTTDDCDEYYKSWE